MRGGGMLDFGGLGGPALAVILLLLVVGVTAAIRGYWGNSVAARKVVVLAALLTLPAGFLVGGFLLVDGYDLVAQLGPAATPADLGVVWRRALSPALAACAAFCVTVGVAGVGWMVRREPSPPQPPPRRPAS